MKLAQQRFLRIEDVAAIEKEMPPYWDGLAATRQGAVTRQRLPSALHRKLGYEVGVFNSKLGQFYFQH